MRKTIVLAITFLLFFIKATAQQTDDKDALQQQREQLRREIAETEKALNETRKTAKVNIGQLSLINKKLDLQGNVIDNISSEIKNLNNNIYLAQKEVNKMSRILDTLKQEYSNSMVYAYKSRSNYNFLNFIFSASSFNDAIKRVAYLKSYRSYREMQAENILRTQDMLADRIKVLSGTKIKKNFALKEQDRAMTQLEKQQEEKKSIVNKLKSQQKELTAQVNAKRKQDAKLKNMITAMIRREVEIARNEAAKREKARLAELKKNNANSKNTVANSNITKTTNPSANSKPTGSVLVSSEADKALDANFYKNRGILPWPVSGYITEHYGPNKLPGGVIYDNPGVTIGAKIGEPVKAVFEGQVTLVSYMEDKLAVFIKHGKYFTVYSNLASANVQRGDEVKTGQVIGKTGENDEGQGEVDFIIMQETTNVNPEQWLRH
ncbi:peptidoglycan DD-metalloendopeptidase family protein [Ginsengibacter hankyongi]|uniref:Peptidoglycan DD-metalloendopeptidase family protein n=1 Tax=Ginsengibacter hankyongi TaxID=2607284 RepID=A0A5J5IKJ3_9BACT|nr:peptidoglycan DD-metalloendopeptidase family protein [Ginsengibacter hankyongi]KAA9041605.1 peptidoglycan DD-metalloendopeptidase family protein [Ginsengibacter hankyongi]